MKESGDFKDLTNLPLSSNQLRIWIVSQHNKLNPSYNLSLTYHFKGEINYEIFKKSVDILFNKHYTIFSVFKQNEGVPYIEIIKRDITVEFIDFSDIPSDKRKDTILSFAGEDSRKCFDIENGPLYRLYLLKYDATSYFFHLTIHHLIFDGRSVKIFVSEISRIYTDLCMGKVEEEEVLKYHTYDSWDNKTGLDIEEKEFVEFWKENLKDSPVELKFPYDYSRKSSSSGLGYREPFLISDVATRKLRELTKKKNSTIFKTMLSVLGVLLQKYTRDYDICIGIPVSNRRASSSQKEKFGMLVSTSVIRLNIQPETNFIDLISYTKDVANKAIENSILPFEKIVEAVNPIRASNTNPLFQVALSWWNDVAIPMELNGLKGKLINVPKGVSPFDMTFYIWENENTIEGEIEYSSDLLKADTVLRLKNHLLNLVNNLVENSETDIESLSMISDEEKKMISDVNDVFTEYSQDKTIIQLFEERAVLNPESVALEFDSGKLTYSELNEKASRLADVLRTYSIGSGDFIGLMLRRSPELIICLLAILKNGAAYVPLNLADPEKRIMTNIISSKIKYLITNKDHNIKLEGICERLNIEQLINRTHNIYSPGKQTVIKSTDPAYIIFTSGTTGIPKGVLVNHKSVINLIEWVNKKFLITQTDKLLWVTNLNFDLSVYDIFGILAAGATIRIVNDEDRQDPKKLYYLLLNEGITFWDSAPQNLQQISPLFNRKSNPGVYNSLRLVFLSGDWIPISLPSAVTSVFPSAVVVGLGGATEATIWSNYFIVDDINTEWKSIPYGKPIQNARYYILDGKMNHCCVQQPGNLYIGGDCLALGYYNDPVLTNSKFIPDPYNSGSKLYLTGDRAQWMPDGNILFLGREDEQIKVRGYRVEIGEIKNAALKNKAIKEAIVIPDKTDRHNIKVLLFITTYNEKKLDVKDLKKQFREHLPEYMIPAEIIQYTKFPVTQNGKIDTKALFSDYSMSLINNSITISEDKHEMNDKPLSPTEKIIHKIWSEALKTEKISVTDNFFDIGGNSVMVISVFSKIESAFDIEMDLRVFFDNPRIQALAENVDVFIKRKMKSEPIRTTGDDLKIVGGEI